MDSHTDLQNPPQQQPRTNPPPSDPSPANPEDTAAPRPPPATNHDTDGVNATALKKLRAMQIGVLSKTFGHIPDIPIFTRWNNRMDCSNSAVHRHTMAGICGNPKDGVYSLALSNLYKDDEDGGDTIIYTGAGGRQKWTNTTPRKRMRLGPQIMDQSWDKSPNNALIVSFHSGNPVRVIRSWRCRSQYAPLQGYRYDGLYRVADYWTARGHNGKKICRCRLERLPGQPHIPLRPITSPASRKRIREPLFSRLTPNPSTSTNDVDTGPNQTDTSPAQLAEGDERESVGSPQQQAMPEAVTMGEVDPDVKAPQLPSHHRRDPPKPGVLPTYRWDQGKNRLMMLPTSHPNQEDLDAAEGDEEEHRGEDDATLVPSEDGHAHAIDERMETEYFTDEGN